MGKNDPPIQERGCVAPFPNKMKQPPAEVIEK
jgi:hypothetical protein